MESLKNKNLANLTYLDWNNKIAQYFFKPEKIGHRIWFSVERDIIEKIATENNVSFDNFIEMVKKGPSECIHQGQQKICAKAYNIFKKWDRKSEYPPYIAYLALFVLAVNHGDSDDFSEINYYGRLRDILNEKSTLGQYPSFDKMLELWDDLEKWSLEDKKGGFGEFSNDIYGNKIHVGIPFYQVVLTDKNKNELPKIFLKMGWDSNSKPTEEETLKALKYNKNLLSGRTVKRIENGKPEFLSILTDRVLEELREYEEELEIEKGQESIKKGSIILCLEMDNLAKKINFYFRCKGRKAGLPDEDFILKNNTHKWKVSTSPDSIISEKIKDYNIVDWKQDFSATAENQKYKFIYKGAQYKIFTSAEEFEISGWISGQRPMLEKLFYLAVYKDLFDKVKKWGKNECEKCEIIKFSSLPKNWHLFEIKGIKGDKLIKDIIPVLSIDKKQRIQFEEGIRPSRGNKFFDFASPKISITGGINPPRYLYWSKGDEQGMPLIPSIQDRHIFFLPKNIPIEERIKVSDRRSISTSTEDKIEQSFILIKTQLKMFSNYLDGLKIDKFGCFYLNEKISEDQNDFKISSLQGAYGPGLQSIANFQRFPHLLLSEMKKVYLIGKKMGEIIVFPNEPLPDSWIPCWMIQRQSWKKFQAYFLGNKKVSISKNDFQNTIKKDKIHLWKKIVYRKRKQIKPDKRYKKNWKSFLEEVKNV